VAYGYAGAGTGEKAWKIEMEKLSYGRCTPIRRFNSKEWERERRIG
jgi:hypothetical protein